MKSKKKDTKDIITLTPEEFKAFEEKSQKGFDMLNEMWFGIKHKKKK